MKLSVLHEEYCDACGGWDTKQGGTGHKIGCPIAKTGTPITMASSARKESKLWGHAPTIPVDHITSVYSKIKEHGGVITDYDGSSPDYVGLAILFDSYDDADAFGQRIGADEPVDIMKRWPRYSEYLKLWDSGEKEHEFVREFGLS